MNLMRFSKSERIVFFKVFLFSSFLLLFPISVSYVFIKDAYIYEIQKSLNNSVGNIKKDIVYKNGKWNVDLYNSDPYTPSPNSLNSFPLYIITIDGFIIERSRPIGGLLDSADFKQLLRYKTPETIHTPTNETWRVFSIPVKSKDATIGVVSTLLYNPNESLLKEADEKLKINALKILSRVKYNKNSFTLDIARIKDVSYDISYEVVNSYNKILVTYGRAPSFIDPSYVVSELNKKDGVETDETTKEQYFVISRTITNEKGLPVGIIVAGRQLSSLASILNKYLIFSILTRIIFSVPLTILVVYLLRREILNLLKAEKNKSFSRISFDVRGSFIEIDKTKIQIPYSSNQYYLCKAVFSAPKKLWETDELLYKFGDSEISQNGRKVYDAMLAVNKKLQIRLITHRDKTYRFNQEFVEKIKPHL